MDMIIVSLTYRCAGGEKNYDMELPCHVPVNILIKHIVQTLNDYASGSTKPLGDNRQLHCRRLNRTLEPAKTLAQEGVWSGDYLDLK